MRVNRRKGLNIEEVEEMVEQKLTELDGGDCAYFDQGVLYNMAKQRVVKRQKRELKSRVEHEYARLKSEAEQALLEELPRQVERDKQMADEELAQGMEAIEKEINEDIREAGREAKSH
jgi:hypothetical protein